MVRPASCNLQSCRASGHRHTHTHRYTQARACAQIHIHTHTPARADTYKHMQTQIHTRHRYTHTDTHTHAGTHTDTHTHARTHNTSARTHTHTHTHTHTTYCKQFHSWPDYRLPPSQPICWPKLSDLRFKTKFQHSSQLITEYIVDETNSKSMMTPLHCNTAERTYRLLRTYRILYLSQYTT